MQSKHPFIIQPTTNQPRSSHANHAKARTHARTAGPDAAAANDQHVKALRLELLELRLAAGDGKGVDQRAVATLDGLGLEVAGHHDLLPLALVPLPARRLLLPAGRSLPGAQQPFCWGGGVHVCVCGGGGGGSGSISQAWLWLLLLLLMPTLTTLTCPSARARRPRQPPPRRPPPAERTPRSSRSIVVAAAAAAAAVPVSWWG
jgi:hypothetical protein